MLRSKLGHCKLCDVELVCAACDARRQKPLPRESMFPDEDEQQVIECPGFFFCCLTKGRLLCIEQSRFRENQCIQMMTMFL